MAPLREFKDAISRWAYYEMASGSAWMSSFQSLQCHPDLAWGIPTRLQPQFALSGPMPLCNARPGQLYPVALSDVSICYAKSLQSCPTLCDPTDRSPPASPVPGILKARTLEWVAISFPIKYPKEITKKLLEQTNKSARCTIHYQYRKIYC